MRSLFLSAAMCASLLGATACNRQPASTTAMPLAQDQLTPVGTTGSFTTPPQGFEAVNLRGGQTYVNCGPDRRPVVRPAMLNGSTVEHVECVGPTGASYAPVATAPVVTERVVTERRVVEPAPRRHRSWQKSAVVIGGSTAAGAGVGALVGGKKGALIGALAGGGAGTVYEVKKRKKKHR